MSKAATGNCLAGLGILKGTTSGQLRYKGNDRKYGAYGIMNETDFKFNTNFFGKNIGHALKVGYKYHYDYHNRDQQNHNFTQAVGGAITNHASGVTQSDDRHEKSRGHVAYFEESATINNFVASFGARFEYVDMHYRNTVGAAGTSNNTSEETFMFAPGGGLLYNHDENWQWFFGVYKGFNIASPGTVRDDGTPVEKETSIAKEVGVRYNDQESSCYINRFSYIFRGLNCY